MQHRWGRREVSDQKLLDHEPALTSMIAPKASFLRAPRAASACQFIPFCAGVVALSSACGSGNSGAAADGGGGAASDARRDVSTADGPASSDALPSDGALLDEGAGSDSSNRDATGADAEGSDASGNDAQQVGG